jgi:hypothetical protein
MANFGSKPIRLWISFFQSLAGSSASWSVSSPPHFLPPCPLRSTPEKIPPCPRRQAGARARGTTAASAQPRQAVGARAGGQPPWRPPPLSGTLRCCCSGSTSSTLWSLRGPHVLHEQCHACSMPWRMLLSATLSWLAPLPLLCVCAERRQSSVRWNASKETDVTRWW